MNLATVASSMAVVALAALVAQPVAAGCLDYKPPKTDSSQVGSFVKVSNQEDNWNGGWEQPVFKAPIVGLWAFKYISKGNLGTLGIPDGTILDGGNTLWYADGNENTVSGVRDPETGNVCLGVWKRTGAWTYELNHIGLSWDPVHHVPGGPAFIKQYVTLGKDENSYQGSFSIRQLGPDGKTLATPAPIVGKIVATRVTIDTDTQESLP